MSRTALKSAQALAAHSFLFCFTLLLLLKLDHAVSYSWWIIFVPVWMFHGVVVRGRFSIPAPSVPHARQWAPCHAVVATPLLFAFELLLCIYLESVNARGFAAVNLKIVFLPLLAFEIIILIDNFRMCRALMPVDIERGPSTDDEALCQMLPHLWIAISMVFLVIATVLTLLKLSGDVALGSWDLFITFGIAESFAFLVCTKGSNPIIERNSAAIEAGSSTTTVRYLSWIWDTICSLQNIGGYIMKIAIIGFQVVLCMYLEGTPAGARHIPLPILFSPLFLMQGAAVLIAASRLIDKIACLLWSGAGTGLYSRISSRGHDCLGLFHHGSRLLSWWSIDEGSSREEQALLYHDGVSGYKTFFGYTPEIVKKIPKKDLAEEVWRLQAALVEQTEISKHNQQEYEKLQNLKVICRVCSDREINVVLLPCRHRTLCSICSERCLECPICRVSVEERLLVYDA